MGLVTGITRRVEVPGEDGAWLELRMLSWLQIDEAKRVRLAQLVDQMKLLSGVQLPESSSPAEADPFDSLDRLTLLRLGVVSWSYGEQVAPEELDQATATWAARQVYELAVPTDVESKKHSSPSTGI